MRAVWLMFWLATVEVVAQPGPSFAPLRYNDDVSALAADTSLPDAYRRFKYHAFRNGSFVSAGGEVRYQYLLYQNEQWGDAPPDDDGYFYTRALFHAGWQASGRLFVFAQLKSNFMSGRPQPPRSIDVNLFDVHQAFVRFGSSRLQFFAGRQELLFGAQRLISVREGPNNRLTFDALRVVMHPKSLRLEALVALPAFDRTGVFDDPWFQRDVRLTGVYVVSEHFPNLGRLDVYYLHLFRRDAVFDEASGVENRHLPGVRLSGKRGAFRYDLEAVVQFGSLDSLSLRGAYTLSANLGLETPWKNWKPLWGLKTEIISGNRSYEDNRMETFNALFPRGAYFGLAALIGPANLIDLHPSVEWPMGRFWSAGVDYDLFWRHRTADGLYGPNVRLEYSGVGTTERFIGRQLGVRLTFEPRANLSAQVEGTWFGAGPYLKSVSAGKNMLFGAFTLQYKY